MARIIRQGEAMHSEGERQALVKRLADTLDVDVQPLYDLRLLCIMSGDEVTSLAANGFDIQLHTHRHRFPRHDMKAALSEIQENRAKLKVLTGRDARHFCYPSGEFTNTQWPWLEALGIEEERNDLSFRLEC